MAPPVTVPPTTTDGGAPERRRLQPWLFAFVLVALAVAAGAGAELLRREVIPADDRWAAEVAVGAGGGGLVLGLVLLVITVRHQRRQARSIALLVRGQVRSRAVQEVAGRLARALGSDDVVTALVEHLPAAVGAQAAVIATRAEGHELAVLGWTELPSGVHPPRPLPAAGATVVEALRDQEPGWLPSPLGWRGDELADALAQDGMAMALLPLVDEDVVGVLAVSYPRVHTFADDERDVLQTIALLAARALTRGRRYDDEHSSALAFQRAALPGALPEIEGLTIAARYRPGAERAAVGGDWYDVLPLGGRRVALIVGDVVGHGMEAAAAMGRLRTAFQTIASLRDDPGTMVQSISRLVPSIPDAMCTTVVCTVVDLDAGTITWCRSGHPPALLLDHGSRRFLDEPGHPPLGVAPEEPPVVHQCPLPVGGHLILYTDGLVERRGEAIDRALERLAIVAADLADLDPEDFSHALVEALVPAEDQLDDIVVLVVRVDEPSPAVVIGTDG